MTHARLPLSPQTRRLLTRQAGVISYEQARLLLSPDTVRSLVRQGVWVRCCRGIFRDGTQLTWQGKVWAGLLMGGDHATVTGRAALRLEALIDSDPEPITICSPQQVSRKLQGVRFMRGQRPGRGEPFRARVPDALLDSWSESSPGDFQIVLARALRRGLTTFAEMENSLGARARMPGRAAVARILAEGRRGVTSPLESRYVGDVERAHQLPRAEHQTRLPGGPADNWYRDYLLVVELDGARYHEDRARDVERDNVNAEHGIATLRFGWREVTRSPCGVARAVANALVSRGWSGQFTPCQRCLGA